MNYNKIEFVNNATQVLEALCREKGKWGMYVSFNDSFKEVIKAAPYLAEQLDLLFHGSGWVFADTEEEIYKLYEQTVGDDGPTAKNSYSGQARVYALVCNSLGELITENT